MLGTRTILRHLSVAIALASIAAPAKAQAPEPGSATFTVLLRGARVGSERVVVTRTGNGWLIASTGQLFAPFDLITTKFEVSYASDWQPRQLVVEGVLGGQSLVLMSSFGLTTATNDLIQGTQRASNTLQTSARTIVLPNNFFSAYEALAARLSGAAPGTRLPVFIAPEQEVAAVVDRVATRRILIADTAVEVTEFFISLSSPSGVVPIELWVDARQRLVRVNRPLSGLLVIRDDFTSVMTREERVRHAGDEDLFVPANGFNLGATVTKPVGATGRLPAIVLVPGRGPQDRDYVSYGVPVLGELAGSLATTGFLSVRYDSRGIGQSGGRTESATMQEYVDDVNAVVEWLRRRRDVDGERIAVVGYAEAGPLALLAASRITRIKGLALLAAPGRGGRDITMQQQQQLLDELSVPAAEKAARRAMQARVLDATVTGKGWEGVPADLRRQADTPWFRSWLVFQPGDVIGKVQQPMLIVHGERDTEFPPAQADELEALARARKKLVPAATQKVIIPGVNHLLVPATTGATSEYSALTSRTLAPEVGRALTDWLATVLRPR